MLGRFSLPSFLKMRRFSLPVFASHTQTNNNNNNNNDKGTKICSSLHSAISPLHGQQQQQQQHAQNTEEASVVANCPVNNGVPPAASVAAAAALQQFNSSRRSRPQKRQSMSNTIKKMVSKQRIRYVEGPYNLDLSYITDKIIAMGYPASNIEGVYRNSIDIVVKFLDEKHQNFYKVYNLCSERSYDKAKFHDRVEHFPFDDHNPPKIELIQLFCESVHEWLSSHPQNVAIVHCKAGKGRTGTMICCYLLHSKQYTDPQDALNFYAKKRTQDRKGVTIPSQMRYVHYYALSLKDNLTYTPEVLYIKRIVLEPPPFEGQGNVSFCISQQNKDKYKSGVYEIKRDQNPFVINLDSCMPISGDVKVKFNTKKLYKDKNFHFWMNTFFVARYGDVNSAGDIVLTLNSCDLDKQNKSFKKDFKVTVILNRVPKNSLRSGVSPQKDTTPTNLLPEQNQQQHSATPSESSEAETTESDSVDEEDGWDSGESSLRNNIVETDMNDVTYTSDDEDVVVVLGDSRINWRN